jgi:hypothetical protein
LIAYSLKNHLNAEDRIPIFDYGWNLEFVKTFFTEIDDPVAPHTSKMVMGLDIRIIPLDLAVSLDHSDDPDFRKCGQGSINRIHGDIRKFRFDLSEDLLSRRVSLGISQNLINRQTLGSHAEIMLSAFSPKGIQIHFFGLPHDPDCIRR